MHEEDGNQAENVEPLKSEPEAIAKRVAARVFNHTAIVTVSHLAKGGYNHVWLVTLNRETKLILRIPLKTPSLQPYQLRNHVACLQWLATNVPSIPVPKVYDWDDGLSGPGSAFAAEEYIEGQRLSVVWPQLSGSQKAEICGQIANVVADLGETRFRGIGSLMPNEEKELELGPTVEAAKVFNGRTKFHSHDYYDIGPYPDSKTYILACYDREIAFYTHASPEDIEDFFDDTSFVPGFIDQLRHQRDHLQHSTEYQSIFQSIDSEPLVLVHEDFHAGNMLVRDGRLAAVLDWEFAGVYPLSQLLGKAQILQISMPFEERHDKTEEEEDEWHEHYRGLVEEVVKQRKWKEKDGQTLFGDGQEILNVARMIMFPTPE